MRLRKSLVNGVLWMAIILASLWVIANLEVGNLPSSAMLAVSAVVGWFLVGSVNKEGQRNR